MSLVWVIVRIGQRLFLCGRLYLKSSRPCPISISIRCNQIAYAEEKGNEKGMEKGIEKGTGKERKLRRPGGSALLTTVPVSGWPNVVHCCSVQTEALLGRFFVQVFARKGILGVFREECTKQCPWNAIFLYTAGGRPEHAVPSPHTCGQPSSRVVAFAAQRG